VSAAAVTAPHYMVIVEENQGANAVIGSPSAPYISSLANTYATATQWYSIQHNSPADYVALISGSTQSWGTTSPPFAGSTVVDELAARGVDWRAYMEDMPSPCYTGAATGNYAQIHNPFSYFSSILSSPAQCDRVVPFAGNFVNDLNSSSPPPFMWVTPNECNDMHTACAPVNNPVLQGDQWLQSYLPTVLSSSWYASGGVVILTWDEGTTSQGWNGGSGGQIPQLAESLIGSDEYFTHRANGDNSTYVTTLYHDILGRGPDAGGLSYWVGRLSAGDPRFLVSASILEATEARQNFVNGVFQTFLRRLPDAAGLAFWTGALQSGMRDEAFIASIIGSDEYLLYAVTHVL
jgi:hypothetical protein